MMSVTGTAGRYGMKTAESGCDFGISIFTCPEFCSCEISISSREIVVGWYVFPP